MTPFVRKVPMCDLLTDWIPNHEMKARMPRDYPHLVGFQFQPKESYRVWELYDLNVRQIDQESVSEALVL